MDGAEHITRPQTAALLLPEQSPVDGGRRHRSGGAAVAFVDGRDGGAAAYDRACQCTEEGRLVHPYVDFSHRRRLRFHFIIPFGPIAKGHRIPYAVAHVAAQCRPFPRSTISWYQSRRQGCGVWLFFF